MEDWAAKKTQKCLTYFFNSCENLIFNLDYKCMLEGG